MTPVAPVTNSTCIHIWISLQDLPHRVTSVLRANDGSCNVNGAMLATVGQLSTQDPVRRLVSLAYRQCS